MAAIEKLSSGSYLTRIRSSGVREDKTFKTYEEAETYQLRRQNESPLVSRRLVGLS